MLGIIFNIHLINKPRHHIRPNRHFNNFVLLCIILIIHINIYHRHWHIINILKQKDMTPSIIIHMLCNMSAKH